MPAHRKIWDRLTRLDRAALGVVALYAVVWILRIVGVQTPGGRVVAKFLGLLFFLFVISAFFLAFRGLAWLRREGLWSLRNRLAVAYLFIAVVPIGLLLLVGVLSAYLVYSQLGAHLLQDDLRRHTEGLAVSADVVGQMKAKGSKDDSPEITALLSSLNRKLPGIRLYHSPQTLLKSESSRYSGIVQSENQLFFCAAVTHAGPSGSVATALSMPVTPEVLEQVAPELGPIQLLVTRPATPNEQQQALNFAGRSYLAVEQISTKKRALAPRTHWFDAEITGFLNFEAMVISGEGGSNPVFGSFSVRPSQLNEVLFRALGGLADFASTGLFAVITVFLILQVATLWFGIQFTRQITGTVDELSQATQSVQAGDLSAEVRVQRRDQLGALGESFNEMITSISTLIEEQKQRQRLENELSIAREVQAQLFPQEIPRAPGIELAAAVRAARVVSGDYYDFVSLGGNRLGMVIADISGKGISAALLMASLQAALRSQVLLDGHVWNDTRELAARLNRHLFVNTSSDRYATFFYAAYDADTRTLHYTNAGHLPPLYLVGDTIRELEEGGMVVGLFDEATYEQGTIQVEPGALLVAYSDGLVECENVYGEEFGRKGIREELLRHRHETPQRLAEALVQAAEDWTGSPSRADDMTVIVARLG